MTSTLCTSSRFQAQDLLFFIYRILRFGLFLICLNWISCRTVVSPSHICVRGDKFIWIVLDSLCVRRFQFEIPAFFSNFEFSEFGLDWLSVFKRINGEGYLEIRPVAIWHAGLALRVHFEIGVRESKSFGLPVVTDRMMPWRFAFRLQKTGWFGSFAPIKAPLHSFIFHTSNVFALLSFFEFLLLALFETKFLGDVFHGGNQSWQGAGGSWRTN